MNVTQTRVFTQTLAHAWEQQERNKTTTQREKVKSGKIHGKYGKYIGHERKVPTA